MSMKIYSGTGGSPAMFDKLLELGACTKIVKETDYVSQCYVNDDIYFRYGVPAAGNTEYIWIDVYNNSPSVYIPIYGIASATTSTTQGLKWKIVEFDTGYLFGLATTSGNNYTPVLNMFIGKTVDKNGVESQGVVCREKNTSNYIVLTGNIIDTLDKRSYGVIKSEYNTVLTPMCNLYSSDKFVDIFSITLSPYTSRDRRFVLNNDYFYTSDDGLIAIRFGGI